MHQQDQVCVSESVARAPTPLELNHVCDVFFYEIIKAPFEAEPTELEWSPNGKSTRGMVREYRRATCPGRFIL